MNIFRCYFSKQIFETWENVGDFFAEQDNIKIAEVDCERQKDLCKLFKINAYPTLLMFKNGVKYEKYVGVRSKNDLVSYVENFVKKGSARDETWLS